MDTIADDLEQMRRTPLFDSHVAALRDAGIERRYAAGDYLVQSGDRMDRFVYVVSGDIEVVNHMTGERLLPHSLGAGQFMGEISFLSGGAFTMPMRAAADTTTIEVARPVMLDLMAKIPEMSDIIISVFGARRRRQIESQNSSLSLIGSDADRTVQAVEQFALRNKIPFQSHDLGSDTAVALADSAGISAAKPAVFFGRDQHIPDATPRKIAKLLGLQQDIPADATADLLIVGGGPAGVAAAVYAGAEGINALVIDELAIGGQAGTSSRIENYMGFPTGISGADLVWRGQVQAMKFGTCFSVPTRATGVERLADGRFCVTLDGDTPNAIQQLAARSILIATGVQYRRLPLDRLEEFEGAGIYYAATDMEARLCKASTAIIIGGGNSAGQAAMFLSRHAAHVHVLVRGTSLASSMSDYLSSRLIADPNITIHYGASVQELHGDASLSGVSVAKGESIARIPCAALFIMVGAAPNTGWLSGLVDLDNAGFVKCGGQVGNPYATSCPGIYAVGDVRAGSVKRVASAVGEGSVVISEVWQYLNG